MQDIFPQILSYALGVWRHRWVMLVSAWVIALAGWVYVWQMPESYVASARLYVDTNSVLPPLMRGLTVTPNVNQRIAMMSRTLLSRPNLEKLSRMTDLDLGAITEAQKEALINRLDDSISLMGTRGDASLYSISVIDRDRDMARRIAQAIITVFIETSVSDKRQDSSGAQSFLESQIAASEKRLVDAEARLALFKQRNLDVLPNQGGDYYSRLQRAQSDLNQVQLELREAENRRKELQRQIDGEDPVFIANTSSSSAEPPLSLRIQSLRLQRESLLSRYTMKHPEVVRLSGTIAELERDLKSQYASMRSQSGSQFGAGGLASSPVYQGMRTMLAETEALAAELSVRVDEYQNRVTSLDNKAKQIPEIEAQLMQLDRDYSVIASQHQEMLERRESARLSGDVEGTAGNVVLRVIDPPFVPLLPSEPNKPLLNAGVLFIALGGGVAIALMFSLLNPIVTDARMLAQSTGLPLLGVVTWNKTAEERRSDRWSYAGFSACLACLIFFFTGLLVVPGMIA